MMAITIAEIERRYPLHWLVWNNRHETLKSTLDSNKFTVEDLELKDPRGRTPLLLAVTLGHLEAVQVLLDAGAEVNCEKDGWTAVQEATARGDIELLNTVITRRDARRAELRGVGVPALLRKLSMAPDFYVEMKWEFTSWVPLVSRMCPFDTYKVYKRGANVRVDTTLLGFENNRWQRGDRSYIFSGQGDEAELLELDHATNSAWRERVSIDASRVTPPSRRALLHRLSQPIATNYLDTDKISFERNKSGVWGWRCDKSETVSGRACSVFAASNVTLVSRTRMEHVPRAVSVTPASPRLGPLALLDEEPLIPTPLEEQPEVIVTPEQYFSDEPLEHDIGKPKQMTTKVQKFKATLWLCEDYPLELQEQIMPILDLMASMSSPHFAKLKDFIQMQLPAGFPVKIEIPLFHVLNARITFGNIFATEAPAPHVSTKQQGDRLCCVIDDACFTIPPGYRDSAEMEERSYDDEEGLLQYAIEQSLMEAGTHDDQVDVWEALRGARPSSPDPRSRSPADLLGTEERELQRAIEESLSLYARPEVPSSETPEYEAPEFRAPGYEAPGPDAALAAALAASAREHELALSEEEREKRDIEEAIRLSLQLT